MEATAIVFTALFVLSTIAERLTEWVKSLRPGFSVKYPEGSREERQRQTRVLKLNIICGCIVAFACKADILAMISDPENITKSLGWKPEDFDTQLDPSSGAIALFIVGCLLTGLFISLGSKFWHDLLDLVLAVKNIKRSVTTALNNNELTVKTPSEQEALLRAAINEHMDSWKNSIRNLQGVSIANKLVGEHQYDTGALSIQFNVTRKEPLMEGSQGKVPTYVYYRGVSIPTDVKETGIIEAAVFTGDGITPKPGGCSICRADCADYTGTLGIRVKMGSKWYAASCFHVLFPEETKKGVLEISKGTDSRISPDTRVLSPSEREPTAHFTIGDVAFGKLSPYVDIAFFETTAGDVAPGVYGMNVNNTIYDFNLMQRGQVNVKFCGRTSGLTKGVLTGIAAATDVVHFRNEQGKELKVTMKDLLEIKMPVAGGDSGAIVLTEDGSLVGMIVASGNGYAYAVSMRAIINNYPFDFS